MIRPHTIILIATYLGAVIFALEPPSNTDGIATERSGHRQVFRVEPPPRGSFLVGATSGAGGGRSVTSIITYPSGTVMDARSGMTNTILTSTATTAPAYISAITNDGTGIAPGR